MALGLYFHIPFCKRKCDYCDFYSICNYDDKLMDRYLEALTSQMTEYFPEKGPIVDTVYIGGGTPSVFGGKRIEKLLKEVAKRVKLSPGAEITVEANPESIDEDFLRRISGAGANRLSMGIQSADNGELASLGRLHTFEKAVEAYRMSLRYIDNISVDLIYGLEGQTLEGWMESLEKTVALDPCHISCYCLKIEDGTPLQIRGCVQPDEDIQADMYLKTIEFLEEKGYKQYEISNFARDGRVSRHNSKYWDLSEYLGLGCAAHSFYGGRRFSFLPDIKAYTEGVLGKKEVVEDMDELAYINRSGEYVMLKLRTAEGIDPEEFEKRFDTSFWPYAEQLMRFTKSGYVKNENGRWSLTPEGFLVSNAIIGEVVNRVCGDI